MNRRTRLLLILSSVLVLAALGGYVYAWLYTAKLIRIQINDLYDDAARVGMRIEGDFPSVSGFPGPHIVHFSGKLVEGAQTLNLPDLRIRGLFLPGYNVSLSLPQGASLEGAADPVLFSISDLDIQAVVPILIPRSLTADDLAAWQRQGGFILVNRFHMRKESLSLDGTGRLTLDGQIQPAGTATVRITGYDAFLDWLKTKNILSDRQAAFAGIVLTGLSRTDHKTGDRVIKTDVSLKNRALYVGPLQVLEVPPVIWASGR